MAIMIIVNFRIKYCAQEASVEVLRDPKRKWTKIYKASLTLMQMEHVDKVLWKRWNIMNKMWKEE